MRIRREFWLMLSWLGCGTVALSCAPESSPTVEFGSAPVVGRWSAAETTGAAGAATVVAAVKVDAGVVSTTGPSAGARGFAGSGASAGHSAAGGAGTAGSAGQAVSTANAGSSSAAGSGGAGAADGGTSNNAIASLAFDVTTSPVGGRYQPRNIGAIWIQDSTGKLVKSLAVWAAVRRRYLTRYATALAGGSVDVVASATMQNHVAHHASWNMKDRSGVQAAPGKYTLVVELTDGDMTGRSTTIAFDTSAGAQTSSPADAPSFSAMKLQLQ